MESYHYFGVGDTHLPPGFRFHPTDEELITYYLLKKVLDRNFTGTLPPELGQLVYLEELYVNSCGLAGEIPSTFVNLQRMTTFWASDAAFTGNIPDFIGNWTGLTSLRFQGNSFEGPIPSSFSNLTSLTSLEQKDPRFGKEMGRKKKVINKDESAEGCCFVCKDGGTLRIPREVGIQRGPHRALLLPKSHIPKYNAGGVVYSSTSLLSEIALKLITLSAWKKMIISWRVKFPGAAKTATFNCLCCPNVVCGCCLSDANLAIIKVKRGFCYHCLTLAGILEGVIDLNEPKVNLSLQDSYEFMFKCY
ncbi:hypothetical protein NC651_026771 [Populus alba x Populus x berolinensis]|nr:hypothetical protein NC651_026771 [Populus alba x Populus x berolinensis]